MTSMPLSCDTRTDPTLPRYGTDFITLRCVFTRPVRQAVSLTSTSFSLSDFVGHSNRELCRSHHLLGLKSRLPNLLFLKPGTLRHRQIPPIGRTDLREPR